MSEAKWVRRWVIRSAPGRYVGPMEMMVPLEKAHLYTLGSDAKESALDTDTVVPVDVQIREVRR